MAIKDKIISKFKSMAHKTYKQAAPMVKREIKKTMEKGKDDVFCYILDGAQTLILGAIMLSVVIKPSDLVRTPTDLDTRKIYTIYNEVHVTNNYYSKEAI